MLVPRTMVEHLVPALGLKMLFIHTPKCGGRAVGWSFGNRFRSCVSVTHPYLKGHLTWLEYENRLPKTGHRITEFVTFSAVRNPFAWHVSWFNYIRKQPPSRTGYEIEHKLFRRFRFSDYVSWLEDNTAPKTPRHDMGKQLSDWVCDESGEIAVDVLLRQENLAGDLDALSEKFGLALKPLRKKINASGEEEDFRTYYSAKDVDAVSMRHQRDLRLFGYEF